MRSSPSKADPLDPGPRGFAHRGLHFGSAPENTLPAFRAALDFGVGIECDLRLTADDRLIVFHDSDARRLCASPLKIGRSRWNDLAGLRIGSEPIPTLENLLALVAGRVPLLLEAKVDGDRCRWLPALRRCLANYRDRFAVMSFDARLCLLMRREMPGVRRGLLLRDRQSAFERHIALRLARPDFLGVEYAAAGRRWVAAARQSLPVYCWTVRAADQRETLANQVDALIWEGDGRPRI